MVEFMKHIYQFRVDAFPEDKQRKIRAGNLAAFLGVSLTSVFGLFYYAVLDSTPAALLIACFAGCYLSYFHFLSKGKHFQAILCLSGTYLCHVFIIVVFFSSPRSGFHFYYLLAGPFLSILTLRGEYRRFKLGIVIISMALFLLCEVIGGRYAMMGMGEAEFKTLYLSNMVLLFVLFMMVNHLLKEEIDDREAALETHANRLAEVNRRLEQEVAERRQAETLLSESRKKLELALDVFEASFWEWAEPGGRFCYDARSHNVLGYAQGGTDFSLDWLKAQIHPESLPRVEAVIDGHLHGEEKHQEIEYRIKDKAGDWRWIESAGLCVEWGEVGQPMRVIGIHRDISRRKEREREREDLISDLQAALSKVNTLSGLLPICASCKKIRDDRGYWNQIEMYIRDHSEAEFSHGICPDCAKRLYPDIDLSE